MAGCLRRGALPGGGWGGSAGVEAGQDGAQAEPVPGRPAAADHPGDHGGTTEVCRNSSRAWMFEMCTSTTGTGTASTASRSA